MADQPNWRELCRRLYVELFHCDQQMRSVRKYGKPLFTQGSTVRDALSEAKSALDATHGGQHPATPDKCDGNHGGPRCADPECWNDSADAPPETIETAIQARKAAQEQLYAARERHADEVKRLQAEIGRLLAAQLSTPEPTINWRGTHFTYQNQPCDNVTCWRLGEAARGAKPGGDLIDHGLSLLQQLQKQGFGVFSLAAKTQPATTEHDCSRSHPHENMSPMCELRTEIARLRNENTRLKHSTTEHKGPLSKDRIREVFLSHGFTVKEGQTDLKPYVYDAANALIALVQPATERAASICDGFAAPDMAAALRGKPVPDAPETNFGNTTERKGEPIGYVPRWAVDRLTGKMGAAADPITWGLYAPIMSRPCPNYVGIYTSPQVPEDTALLDFMEERRVSLIPEYEGPWAARQYDDDPQFAADAEGATPRDALRALLEAARKAE